MKMDQKLLDRLDKLQRLFENFPLPWTDCDGTDDCGDLRDANGDTLAEICWANVGEIIMGAVNNLPELFRAARKVDEYATLFGGNMLEIAQQITRDDINENAALMQQLQVLADENAELCGQLQAAEMTVETQKHIANQALLERDAKDATIRKLHLLNDTEVEVKREMREKLAEKDRRIGELEAALKQTANRYTEGYIVVKLIVNQALEGSDQDGC